MEEKKKIVRVKDLELSFEKDFVSKKILNRVSFDIYEGETLGIAGESGCGKSVTSLSILRLLNSPPAKLKGEILFEDKDMLKLSQRELRKIRGAGISMIFQEPMTSLNPVFTVGNQLVEAIRIHSDMSKTEAKAHAVEMLKAVRIPLPEQRMKEFPFQLSGGMRQRVMIAMALACKPQLLIADEPTTALDVTIQAQVLKLMKELQQETGTAIMFITHDLGVIREVCQRVIVMYCGEIMEEAPVESLFKIPCHPYTQGLLSTLPKFGIEGELPTIPGSVPSAGKFPSGCVFAPRCPYACDRCRQEKPPMTAVGDRHAVRCFRYGEEESHE